MITNVCLYMVGGHIRRGWVNDAVTDNNTLHRFLCQLKKINNLQEQTVLVNKFMPMYSYSKRAKKTLIYRQDREKVKVCETAYDKDKGLFARGRYIEEFSI